MTINLSPTHAAEILKHTAYTAPELAELLGINLNTILHAAHTGELKSVSLDHHVLCIHRDEVIRWLKNRG